MTLTQARQKRGWTFHEATMHMRGVYEQQLRNIEGEGAVRATDPLAASLRVVLEILRAYWPDVSLDDFVGEPTGFRLVATDAGAIREHRATAVVDNLRRRRERTKGGSDAKRVDRGGSPKRRAGARARARR